MSSTQGLIRPWTVVGDPGAGKATLARYVLRWWIARGGRRYAVVPSRAHEYADVLVAVDYAQPLANRGASSSKCSSLLVFDDGDKIDPERLGRLLRGHRGLAVVTSCGPAAQRLEACGSVDLSFALMGIGCGDPAQARLDLPADAIAVRAPLHLVRRAAVAAFAGLDPGHPEHLRGGWNTPRCPQWQSS